jgi:hypothetical protein
VGCRNGPAYAATGECWLTSMILASGSCEVQNPVTSVAP